MHADRHTSRWVYTMFWTLTRNRILNATYMEHLWLYCQQQLNDDFHR